MTTHYTILGVTSDAEPEVIKGAYRALSKKYHPDTSEVPKPEAESKMKAINVAYEILSDPYKRAKYDEEIKTSSQAANTRESENVHPSGSSTSAQNSGASAGNSGKTSSSWRSSSQVDTPQAHPWRRYFAKIYDLYLFVVISVWVGTGIGLELSNALTGYVYVVFCTILLEVGSLTLVGTTPGKWLLSLSIKDEFGNPISANVATKRTLSLFFSGLAFCLPVVSFFTMAFSYRRLTSKGVTQWDESNHLQISAATLKLLKFILFSLSFFFIVAVVQLLDSTTRQTRLNSDALREVANERQQDWRFIRRQDASAEMLDVLNNLELTSVNYTYRKSRTNYSWTPNTEPYLRLGVWNGNDFMLHGLMIGVPTTDVCPFDIAEYKSVFDCKGKILGTYSKDIECRLPNNYQEHSGYCVAGIIYSGTYRDLEAFFLRKSGLSKDDVTN